MAIAVAAGTLIAVALIATLEPLAEECVSRVAAGNERDCSSVDARQTGDDNNLLAAIVLVAGLTAAFCLWRGPERARVREQERRRQEPVIGTETASRTATADAAPRAGQPIAHPRNDQLALWGYITAFLLPIVGVVIGVVLLSKSDSRGGWVSGISLTVGLIALVVIGA